MRRDGIHVLTSPTFSSRMLCAGQGHADELGPLQAVTHRDSEIGWSLMELGGRDRQTEQVLGEATPRSYLSDTTMWKSKSTRLPQTCSFSCVSSSSRPLSSAMGAIFTASLGFSGTPHRSPHALGSLSETPLFSPS